MIQKVKEDGVRKWVTFWAALLACLVSLSTLGILIFKGGAWAATVDSRLEEIDKDNLDHQEDRDLHMPYSEKVKEFVLRQEWVAAQANRDRQLSEIRESSKRVEDRVEKIYDILRTR